MKKPTTPRRRPIAVPATTIVRTFSASRSSIVSPPPTCLARGIANAQSMPSTKTSEPTRSTHGAPTVFRIVAAIGAATVAPSTEMIVSREFASTSSSWESTTAGTSELFAIDWPFDKTSAPNASG